MQPIEADQDQYFTKLALMNGSPSTAPDVIYEDTFQVMPDAEAGYLYPMDEFLDQWEDWDQFDKSAQQAGVATDGKTYGVSLGTDTRALYFHKDVFKEAGLPEDWQPKNWNEILDAARTIKQKTDAIPLAIYGGKAAGEASTMQGFEMLLYGTDDTLYDEESQKWITGSKGFRDALGFYKTVTDEELGLPLDIALESSVGDKTSHELLPAGKVGIVMDGSWYREAGSKANKSGTSGPIRSALRRCRLRMVRNQDSRPCRVDGSCPSARRPPTRRQRSTSFPSPQIWKTPSSMTPPSLKLPCAGMFRKTQSI